MERVIELISLCCVLTVCPLAVVAKEKIKLIVTSILSFLPAFDCLNRKGSISVVFPDVLKIKINEMIIFEQQRLKVQIDVRCMFNLHEYQNL